MNVRECDILLSLSKRSGQSQRELAAVNGYALGTVNSALKVLMTQGMIDGENRLTATGWAELAAHRPKNAVILAAGYGMRMVPINLEIPKALLEVRGETLIERQIRQLHEAGITEIYVVVGYLKERFEYLIDKCGVKLVCNPDYASKNNLYSLNLVSKHLGNTYIVPCDIWCAVNPFSEDELYSWYMVSDKLRSDSLVRINRKMELVLQKGNGNEMIGISYLLKADAQKVKERIACLCTDERNSGLYWEEALYEKGCMNISARVFRAGDVIEINTYEQLRDLDSESGSLKSDAIEVIAQTLNVRNEEITDIQVLKKGMTNRSFLFRCREKRYIMRIPGEGTDQLINRRQEAQVYREICGKGICDQVVYLNPQNGYKITEYVENARVCDPLNEEDLCRCMQSLRTFHEMKLSVEHTFDLFGEIEHYEQLRGGSSVYIDYTETKRNVCALKEFIQAHCRQSVLTHIDAVPDNFLFAYDEQGKEKTLLIDWEYAGMQDPHVDIAMFCVYSFFDRTQIDHLIDLYFENKCALEDRIKIYCYVSICGLLWSNWCEYKRNLGVEFGEYSLRQYRYAKEYYRIASEEIRRRGGR